MPSLWGLHFTDQLYGYSGRDVYAINHVDGATDLIATLDLTSTVGGAATLPTSSIEGSGAGETLYALLDNVAIRAGGGADEIFGSSGKNQIFCGRGADVAFGRAGKDEISGQRGADTLKGGSGSDKLFGGAGKDELSGGTGRDVLSGGSGNDVLKGGPNEDRFVFGKDFGQDKITDFRDDLDILDLRNLKFDTKKQLMKNASQDGGDVVFEFGADELRIKDMTKADLLDDLLV